jgi:hypothetical protein
VAVAILNGYSGCSVEDILSMPEQELRLAILRAFSVRPHKFSDGDSMRGFYLLEDEVADAFRGRT